MAELAKYEDANNLRDIDFIRTLGVSIELWRATRLGKKPLGFRLLAAGMILVNAVVYSAARESITERASLRGKVA